MEPARTTEKEEEERLGLTGAGAVAGGAVAGITSGAIAGVALGGPSEVVLGALTGAVLGGAFGGGLDAFIGRDQDDDAPQDRRGPPGPPAQP